MRATGGRRRRAVAAGVVGALAFAMAACTPKNHADSRVSGPDGQTSALPSGAASGGGPSAEAVAASSTSSSADDCGNLAARSTDVAVASRSASGETTPPTPMELPAIDPATLRCFYDQTLSWKLCDDDDDTDCATLVVPLDYKNPGGATISLAVARHDGESSDPLGSLIINPGGPGESGITYLDNAWKNFDRETQDRFDIVSFDPRGIGKSDPVRCVSGSFKDEWLARQFSDDAAGVAKAQQYADEFTAGCEKNSGALLPYIGTADTARDMDILRAALGDEKLTYVGESYGTFLGAIYAQLFPTHVRAMVLDGAVDPTLDDVTESLQQAQGFETGLRSFIAQCVKGIAWLDTCALGKSTSGAEARLDTWLAGLATKPEKGSDGRVLTTSLAVMGIAADLYQPDWLSLDESLQAAMDGKPDGLLLAAYSMYGRDLFDDTYSNVMDASIAINCADQPTVVTSFGASMALAKKAAAAAPTFGEYIGGGDAMCLDWPAPASLSPGPVHAAGAPPIVVIGTLRDPATPYAWAQSLAKQLDSGVLVTSDADGHTANFHSQCIVSLIGAYTVSLTVPAAGTVCTIS